MTAEEIFKELSYKKTSFENFTMFEYQPLDEFDDSPASIIIIYDTGCVKKVKSPSGHNVSWYPEEILAAAEFLKEMFTR